jgi:hypothetical protein
LPGPGRKKGVTKPPYERIDQIPITKTKLETASPAATFRGMGSFGVR